MYEYVCMLVLYEDLASCAHVLHVRCLSEPITCIQNHATMTRHTAKTQIACIRRRRDMYK